MMNDVKAEIAIALASNPEFVKIAHENYDGKYVGYCVYKEINRVLEGVAPALTNHKEGDER
jgi:hypothetical protein